MPCLFQNFNRMPNYTHQAYRYGIFLACMGVVLNWIGVAQSYIDPLRYLGVGLVVFGSILIIAAMCQWMFRPVPPPPPLPYNQNNSERCEVTIPMVRSLGNPHPDVPLSKPPEYSNVVDKPPTYEEAIQFLTLNENENLVSDNMHSSPLQVPKDESDSLLEVRCKNGAISEDSNENQAIAVVCLPEPESEAVPSCFIIATHSNRSGSLVPKNDLMDSHTSSTNP